MALLLVSGCQPELPATSPTPAPTPTPDPGIDYDEPSPLPPGHIRIWAGGGLYAYRHDGEPADEVPAVPGQVAVSADGSIYFTDYQFDVINRRAPDGSLWTVAGNGTAGPSDEPVPATESKLDRIESLVLDEDGRVYFVDAGNYRVARLDPDGMVTTIWEGVGSPDAIALDGLGSLYVTAGYFSIESPGEAAWVEKLDLETGTSTLVGGIHELECDATEGDATVLALYAPSGILIDADGNLLLADAVCHWIWKIDPAGHRTLLAGTGEPGFSGDGGPAREAQLDHPTGISIDADGNVLVADQDNHRVRRISAEGTISTIAGDGSKGYYGQPGGPLEIGMVPARVTAGANGQLLISDQENYRVLLIEGEEVTHLIGNGEATDVYDGELAAGLSLFAKSLVTDQTGSILLADTKHLRIRRVTPDDLISTSVGTGNPYGYYIEEGGSALETDLQFDGEPGMVVDALGNLFFTEAGRIRKVTPAGQVYTIAGTGHRSYSGDGGPATEAELTPYGQLALDRSTLYFIDFAGTVRRINSEGIISTTAGIEYSSGCSQEGAMATRTSIDPSGIAIDLNGRLIISNERCHTIVRVESDYTVRTIAGTGQEGFSGDEGPATKATLTWPGELIIDKQGNLYFTDGGSRVRMIDPDGNIHTVAGNGTISSGEEGGLATETPLYYPRHLTMGPDGSLYVSDANGSVHRIYGPVSDH